MNNGIAGADELRGAAEVIRVKGHCKGMLEDMEGHVCLVGAIMAATDMGERRYGAARRSRTVGLWDNVLSAVDPVLEEVAAEQYPDRIKQSPLKEPLFVAFNNHPDTTPAEVIAVLEKAAARLEERT